MLSKKSYYGVIMILWVLGASAAYGQTDAPQQIHLSSQGEGSFTVMWMTNQSTATSTAWVQLVSDHSSEYTKVEGSQFTFVNIGEELRTEVFHTVRVDGFAGSREWVRYYVGDEQAGVSETFQFQMLPSAGETEGYRFLAYADFGLENDRSLAALTKAVLEPRGQYSFIMHAGDEAYDLFERNGRQGDDFMNAIQPIAANMIYQIGVGNHEIGPLGDFHDYKYRYAMPNYEQSQNLWWSMDIGLVHYIMMSSEHWFDVMAIPFLEEQLTWLEADLQAAVANRERVPWILVFIHRPLYCSNAENGTGSFESDCTSDTQRLREGVEILGEKRFGLEAILAKYGVDLYYCGHEHSFEVTWPVLNGQVLNGTSNPQNPYENPRGLTNIIAGNAGNREGYDPFALGPQGDWSAIRKDVYGYGVFTIYNASHLLYEAIDDVSGDVFHEILLIRTEHTSYQ